MKKVICAILALVSVASASVAITVWVMGKQKQEPLTSPVYTTIPEEVYAQTIPGDSSEKMESESGGGSVNLTYSDQVRVSTGEKLAHLMFANPGRSNQNLTVQVLVNGEVIAQSGLLVSGHKIEMLALQDGVASRLSIGEYSGSFLIQYYDPNTGAQAYVTTEIPVTITVEK